MEGISINHSNSQNSSGGSDRKNNNSIGSSSNNSRPQIQNLQSKQSSGKQSYGSKEQQNQNSNQMAAGDLGDMLELDLQDMIKGLSQDDMLTSNDYMKEMKKLLSLPGMFSAGGSDNISGNSDKLKRTTQQQNQVNNQSKQQVELINLESPNDNKNLSNKKSESMRQSIQNKSISEFKSRENIMSQKPSNFESQQDDKNSTSPPSNSNRVSMKPRMDGKDTLVQNVINSSFKQQQLLSKLLVANQSSVQKQLMPETQDNTSMDIVNQLQQMVQTQQNQLLQLEKNYTLILHENESFLKNENELTFQRLRIKSEIENDQALKQEIVQAFGSSQKFQEALKSDYIQILSYIKSKLASNKIETASSKVKHQSKQSKGSIKTENQSKLKRKGSDPQFDNEEYLKMIEEKYLQQFEQTLIQENQQQSRQEINSLRQSKEKLSVINNEQIIWQNQQKQTVRETQANTNQTDNKKKKKRIQSEDKFDKKEFQERMELQIMNMIKKQFPVEDSDEDTIIQSESNLVRQQSDETMILKAVASEKQKIPSNLLITEFNEGSKLNTSKNNNASQSQSSHKKQRSSKILQIDMPEEIVRMLSDSKDMLEDPSSSNINFFDLENYDDTNDHGKTQKIETGTDLMDQSLSTINGSQGGGIETPAFGKRKTPSLAHFKGLPISQTQDKSSNAKRQTKRENIPGNHTGSRSPDLSKNIDKNLGLDGWKQEVKKVFQKKPSQRTNQTQSKSPTVLSMQQSTLSPSYKQSKSPTNNGIGISRNTKLEGNSSQNLSARGKLSSINQTPQDFNNAGMQVLHTQVSSFQSQYSQMIPPHLKHAKTSRSPTNVNQSKLKAQSRIVGGFGGSKQSVNAPQAVQIAQLMINPVQSSRNQKTGGLGKIMTYQQPMPSNSDNMHAKLFSGNSGTDLLGGSMSVGGSYTQRDQNPMDYVMSNQSTMSHQQITGSSQIGISITSTKAISGNQSARSLIKSRNQGPSKSPSLR